VDLAALSRRDEDRDEDIVLQLEPSEPQTPEPGTPAEPPERLIPAEPPERLTPAEEPERLTPQEPPG
jgi:hypothetical protein